MSLDLTGTCTISSTITPIRLYLKGYFAQLLQRKKSKAVSTEKSRVKPRFYGEALTVDEVYERMAAEEHEKKGKKAKGQAWLQGCEEEIRRVLCSQEL